MILKEKNLSRVIFFALFLVSFIFLSNFPIYANAQIPSLPPPAPDYRALLEEINIDKVIDEIKQHAQFFSSFETRLTGSYGCEQSAKYIYDKFVEYGLLNVSYHEYEIAVCLDHGAYLTFNSDNETLRIYPMRPNFGIPSTTPPEGITGRLVYVKKGHLVDFDGQEIEGNIVVMDWESGKNWINAAKLGAKAVIFLPPKQIPTYHVPETVQVPFRFPRFYVPNADIILNRLNETVTIKANTYWEKVVAKNVMGYVPGTEYPNRYILLTAYYDSDSVFPSLAPGAQESLGVSALLEIAKWLSKNRPKYPVIFIAFSGHHQSLSGSYAFIRDFVWPAFNLSRRWIGMNIIFQLNIELTTGSKAVMQTNWGDFMRRYDWECAGWNSIRFLRFVEKIVNEINDQHPFGQKYEVYIDIDSKGRVAGLNLKPMVRYLYRRAEFKSFIFDSDPLCGNIGGQAWTFHTVDFRLFQERPYDTLEYVNFENLRPQLELLFSQIYRLLTLPKKVMYEALTDVLGPDPEVIWQPPHKPHPNANYPPDFTVYDPSTHSPIRSYNRVSGRIGVWNKTKAWYDPVPNALVRLQPLATTFPPFVWYTFTDENGYFEFYGVFHYPGGASFRIDAFVLNKSDGSILYAPDFGIHAYAKEFQFIAYTEQKYMDIGYFVIFECASLVIFDTINPTTLAPPRAVEMGEVGAGGGGMGAELSTVYTLMVEAYKTKTHISLESFGTFFLQSADYSFAVAFIPPKETSYVVFKAPGALRYPLLVLVNASEENPKGTGYALKKGEQLIITKTAFAYAENLYYTVKDRFEVLKKYNVQEYERKEYAYFKQAASLLQKAKESFKNRKYSEAYALSFEAVRLLKDAYFYTRIRIEDSASTVPILALFLIPFTLLFEKLVINASGRKKIPILCCLFIIVFVAFYQVHPGFSFAISPQMIVIGLSTLILAIPIFVLMLRGGLSYIKAIRVRLFGKHEVEVGRASTTFWAFSLGVENMRRRKLRTSLVLIAAICMVIAFVNLASIAPLSLISKVPLVGETPTYVGIYIHRTLWGGGVPELGDTLLEYLTIKYEDAIIAPRAWAYTQYSSYIDYVAGWRVHNPLNNKTFVARALLGLTPQEAEIWDVEALLVKGRWFVPKERLGCILGEKAANTLDVDVGDIVRMAGLNFRVIGIISDDLDFIRDLDGEGITPLKMDWPMGINPLNVHLKISYYGDGVVIIPYETCISMGTGASLASITVVPKNLTLTESIAEEIFAIFSDLNIYFSTPEREVWMLSKASSIKLWGIESQMFLWAVLAVSLLNIMLGNVYERTKEIQIYSSLGLNPLHASIIFFAEATIYALVGSMLGYLIAMIVNKVVSLLSPGLLIQNFSSTTVIHTVLISMGAILLSTIYPMIKASRLVVPSLERAWRIPTRPVGNEWSIPLPFRMTDEKEVNGVIAFLKEYLNAHVGERPPEFSVDNLRIEAGEIDGRPYKVIKMTNRLFPYEMGVIQNTQILFLYNEEERSWVTQILLERVSGITSYWENLNRQFIDFIRKQLLLWRSLKGKEKEKYMSASI